jgi:hypothetical protein
VALSATARFRLNRIFKGRFGYIPLIETKVEVLAGAMVWYT